MVFFLLIAVIDYTNNDGCGSNGSDKVTPWMIIWPPIEGSVGMIEIRIVTIISKTTPYIRRAYIRPVTRSDIGVSPVYSDIPAVINIDISPATVDVPIIGISISRPIIRIAGIASVYISIRSPVTIPFFYIGGSVTRTIGLLVVNARTVVRIPIGIPVRGTRLRIVSISRLLMTSIDGRLPVGCRRP